MSRAGETAPTLVPYPDLCRAMAAGFSITINERVGGMRLCAISDARRMVASFERGRMKPHAVLAELDALAREYLDEGWINDRINGERYQV